MGRLMSIVLTAWMLLPAGAALAAPDAELLESKGCTGCHSMSEAVVGPAFQDIAAKYRGDAKAAAKLRAALKRGEGHPVQVEATDAEMDALLKIVLSAKPGAAAKADAPEPIDKEVCLGCHGQDGFTPHLDREAFEKSVHAPRQCVDCHANITAIPHERPEGAKPLRLTVPDLCGRCHVQERKDYATSVHGQEVLQNGNLGAAVCSDCHTPHAIARPALDATRLAIVDKCGNCHAENLRTYTGTYHGKVHTLGYAYTAKCYDCHGNHAIKRVSDPASMVHPDHRLETCRKCHAGATRGFITFEPHATTHDFARYPQVWIAAKFMVALLVGVFVFFWTHTALWFYREYRDRQARKLRPHVDVSGVELAPAGRMVRRFGPVWRLAHLLFALSVMTLVLTGMAVFFADTAWAKGVVALFGGPKVAGLVHRSAAATMLGIFFIHLVYLVFSIGSRLRSFRWFGPDSLVPNWQDLKDIVAMFAWFFGRRPRPQFERWTYWEKFDYWAVFWGMAIIGGSGFMLAVPNLTASVLPGWVFNVATIVHGEEAILAAVFLFTVHFFNNHFRPDKFPLDIVMFTGAVPLEEFKREHALEYQRLVAAGELEKRLVEAPSRPMTLGSKVLGFTLLAIGLTLLVLVVGGLLSRA